MSIPPDEAVNRQIAHGLMERKLSDREAAEWIRRSIVHKWERIPPDLRARTMLVLDARHVAIFASDSVVAEFWKTVADGAALYGFAQIWLIGPIAPRSRRLL